MAVFGAADPGSNPGRAMEISNQCIHQYIFKPNKTKLNMANKIEITKITLKEIESKVVELSKSGNSPEKIGLILRDQHGIPKAKLYGKKICQILKEKNLPANPEYQNTVKKVEKLKEHFAKNKHDYYAQRNITKYSSKIRKLEKLAK